MVTRVWQSGAESGSVDELTASVGSATISTAQKKTGTYSFLDEGTVFTSYHQINFSALSKLRIGFFYYGSSGLNNTEALIFRNNTSYLATMKPQLDFRADFYAPSATLRGQAVNAASQSWKHIGIDIYFNASGWMGVYVDGSTIFELTSINTGATSCNNIVFGHFGQFGQTDAYWDDLYIDDLTGESAPSPVPIKRFYSLTPNGDGNYSQWNPLPTGSHYQNVDERPPDDDTSYLEAITGSLLDSFDMTTFTLDNNEKIIAMIPYVSAKRGGITEQISLGTRSSGTDLIGSAQDLSTDYDYYWERQVTGSLGFDWSQSYMDSVEVLINSTGTY